MKKFLPLIEKYVQWVALGLGALFVLYMVYSYVIVPPVTATAGGRKVDLGDVDKVTREGPAADLERAMTTGASTEIIDKIKINPVLPKFQAGIANANDPAAKVALTADGWNAPTTALLPPGTPGAPSKPGTPSLPLPGGNQPPQVAELAMPAPTFVAMMSGRSNVVPPPPPTNPVAGAAPANPAAPAPVQPVQPVQAVQGVAGAPAVNPNNPNNLPTVDKNWVSIHYKIPSAAITAAFKKAGVPAVRSVTSFLRVELVREEKLDTGAWGNQAVVGPMEIAVVNAPAWPSGAAPDPNAEQAYIEWARSNAQAILQPLFYQVVKGDLPGDPSQPLLHVGMPLAAVKAFDPLNPGRGPFTEEQKLLIKQARDAEAKRKAEEAKSRRPAPGQRATPRGTRPPTRGGRGGEGGEIAYAPRDNARPVAAYQVRRLPSDVVVPEDMAMEDTGMAGAPGVVTQQNNEALNKLALTIPNPNSFNPEQLTTDVDVLAYDETAQPGKTYRYQMRYYVLNPILGAINLVKDPAQAQKFALASAPSEWTAPVEITPSVNFFLAAGGLVGDSVKLDIYKWQNGDVNKTTQTVIAGDRIGLTDKNGVDFTTPWTIVDVRVGNGDRYVLLQDDHGNTARREFKLDQNNPLHRDLDAQIEAAKAAAAAANPTGTTPPTLTR